MYIRNLHVCKNILVMTGEVKGQGSPVATVAADGLTSAETFLHY